MVFYASVMSPNMARLIALVLAGLAFGSGLPVAFWLHPLTGRLGSAPGGFRRSGLANAGS